MTPAEWAAVKALFEEALERPEAERTEFVRRKAGGDEGVAREVLSLLAAHKGAGEFLGAPTSPAVPGGAPRVPAPAALSAGVRVGPYEVLELLGAGGMGEVYRAHDERLRREVAIKVLPASFAQDTDRVRRFEREARAAAGLSHPNIMAIHDVGLHEGVPYLVAELLEGETLRSRLDKGPLPVRKAIDYAIQIARGLTAAHEKGIVHRDLKPANLFLAKDGRVKILDFGLAKATRPERPDIPGSAAPTALPETEAGMIMGTAGYMSPEQVLGQPVEARSDLFSFGSVLYEMLTGRRAFARTTAVETMSAILNDDPPDLAASNADISPALARIVFHCLEKNPDERFQSARDLAFALGQLTNATSSVSGTQSGLSQTRRWRRGLVPPAAVAALAATFFAGKWLSPPQLLRVERLTPSPRIISSARFLPDGKSIVYTAAPDGSNAAELGELFRLRPDDPPVPLEVRDCRVLDVSASGELALVWNKESIVEGRTTATPVLARIPAAGGTAPRLVEEEDVDINDAARWTRDGQDLIVKHFRYKGKTTQVIVFKGRPLYEVPWGFGLGGFVLNDKGDAIGFTELRSTGYSFVTLGLDGRDITRTLMKVPLTWGGVFPFRKHLIAISTRDEREGPVRLVQLSASGALQRVLQDLPTDAELWDVSPEGDLLMTTGGASEVQEIRWLEPGADRERVLDVGSASLPSLNASGTQLSYSVDKGASYGGALLQAGQVAATSLGEGAVFPQAPDGKTLLERVPDPDGYYRLRLLPTGAGAPRNLPGRWIHSWRALLLDGSKVFVHGRQSDASEMHPYLLDAQASSPQGLSWSKDTVAFVWGPASPDGHTAFAAATLRSDPIAWSRVNLTTGSLTPLPPGCVGMEPRGWTASGDGIWLTKSSAKDRSFPIELWRCNLSTGKAEKIRTIAGPDYPLAKLAEFTVTPDGRSYAYSAGYELPVRKYLFRVSGALARR